MLAREYHRTIVLQDVDGRLTIVVTIARSKPRGQQIAWVGIVDERGDDTVLQGPINGAANAFEWLMPPGWATKDTSTPQYAARRHTPP